MSLPWLAYTSIDRQMLDATRKPDINKSTWFKEYYGNENRLDYILYSVGMLNNTGVVADLTVADDFVIKARYYDHALLIWGIALDNRNHDTRTGNDHAPSKRSIENYFHGSQIHIDNKSIDN